MRSVRVYMRLARKPHTTAGTLFRVDASLKPNPNPLTIGSGRSERELHTVRFAVDLQVPDGLFNPKDWPTVVLELAESAADKLPIAVVGEGEPEVEVEVAR